MEHIPFEEPGAEALLASAQGDTWELLAEGGIYASGTPHPAQLEVNPYGLDTFEPYTAPPDESDTPE